MLKTKTILVATLLTLGFLSLSNLAQISAQTTDPGLEFPYQALVLRDGASVHSGPGKVHYETQDLKPGDAVEVYRHDPGGWCAIRPLKGSFSLVPESTLKIVDKGVGKIAADGTQAWIGTKLGPVEKPLWQVKLKKGEMVEVIGQVSWPNPEGHSTLWYQIAPPAGEFRWIKMDDLQLPVAVSLAMQPKSTPKVDSATSVRSKIARRLEDSSLPPTSIVPKASRIGVSDLDAAVADSEVQLAAAQIEIGSRQEPSNRGWRQSTRPIRKRAVANNSNSSSYQRKQYESSAPRYRGGPGTPSSFGKSPDINYEPQHQPARVPTNRYAEASSSRSDLARSLSAARSSNLAASRLNPPYNAPVPVLNNYVAPTILETHRIDDLEQQLTREMLRDPKQWKLGDLEFRAANISKMTNDPNEKILADKFLKKVENCRKIKFGFETHTGSPKNGPPNRLSKNGLPNKGLSSGSNSVNAIGSPYGGLSGARPRSDGSNSRSNVNVGETYDAFGWLNQMVSEGGQGTPSYVLQDDNGKITHHVSPIQGMNLHRYFGSQVGIIGQRGYHKRLNLDHVTAHRVVEIQKRR